MEFHRFAQNIRQIKATLRNEHQIELTHLLKWPEFKLIELLSGKSPSLDQLSQLHAMLGIPIKTLLSDQWTSALFPITLTFQSASTDLEPFIEIPLFKRKARASNLPIGRQAYSAARPTELKARHLAKLCVPKSFFENKPPNDLKAFEIEGNSMFPNFENGDVVIGQKLEELTNFEEGKPHVLLLKDSSLFFKRLFRVNQSSKKIQLSCDNLLFTSITLGTNLVSECWQVFFHLKKGEL